MDHGAHYYSCDFQVHSPFDAAWKGRGKANDDERKAYARGLVAACRAIDLQAIAITDHHDMRFLPFIRAAALDERDADGNVLSPAHRLVVFPGMELTLGVPCQALVIFDAEFPEDLFSLAMNALAITAPGEPARLDHIQSLVTLCGELDKHTYLRGRYIVLPNASEGKFSLLRTGQAGKYIEMPCVGCYVDGALSSLGQGNRNILAGKDQNYGNKRTAAIQTSDNRNAEHDLLGKHRTWIKWAAPTAEALRQACLAQESRISLDRPALPTVHIERLDVSNSSFLGPISLSLNQQYNALIGGRGTGKSSVLEYLRWGLCDQPFAQSDEGELPNYQMRRSRLIEHTLLPVQGQVEVMFSLNDTPHMVRRDSRTSSLELKIGDGPFQLCTEEQVRSLLPIQAYSQKQLSDVSVRLEELTRFITTPVKAELAAIDAKLTEQGGIVREKYSARERRRTLQANLAQRELVRRSLDQQAAEIRRRLTGLSDDDRALIENAPKYDEADRAVSTWSSQLNALRAAAEQLQQRVANTRSTASKVPSEPEAPILQAIRAAFDAALDAASQSVDAAVSVFRAASEDTDKDGTSWAKWRTALEAFQTRYKAASERSTDHAQRLRELAAVEKQISDVRTECDRIAAEIAELAAADAACDAARAEMVNLRRKRSDLLSGVCLDLSGRSGNLVRATLSRSANTSTFVNALKDVTRGSGMRAERIEGLAAYIRSASDPDQVHAAVLADLEALAVHHDTQAAEAELPQTPALAAARFSAADLQRLARALTQAQWLSLSLAHPDDEPLFEYRAKQGVYIPFANASAGQQATALLTTLLNTEGPPLIIDQPEEDLDNSIIGDIVELIWSAKHKRQIIFASHNANLVVNGDADLVAWCDYRTAGDQSGGKIAGEGAIDIPNVRAAITEIMEGGEAAFKLRRQKYGF